MVCHGAEKQGTPPAIPSLVGVGERLTAEQMTDVIKNGRGRMPGVAGLAATTLTNVISFLTTGQDAIASGPPRNRDSNANKYVFTGYRYFTDPEGYPAGPMPWGTLNAIDMNTGKYLWTVPFGQHPELAEKGLTETGAESHGGSILTATGVLFTGGAEHDLKFRAYDSATGKILWTGQLPGHGAATPATYAVNGKQYVVIASSPPRTSVSATTAAGRELGAMSSATYIVFALP
jgi:quinoprotein glucose dehydrogenase